MRRILSILTTLLLSLTAMAQRYSVTVTPVLLPPYTLNLSELTAQGSAKMMATLTVNDLTAVNLPVRLHFKLESAGITVENIPTSAVAPLFLNGGETQILTGADMAQYLRLDNLEFRGYSKDSYRQTGQLPGGLWKVTIEVRHFHTGRVLSNRGAQTLWVSIYDPPVLTAPRNNTEAPDNPSLPLVFSWQASKHTGGTVAVQYKLELWEMRMEGVPAQTVAASMTPIFETTTQVTSYTAIPTGMNLEPGMRYCWRVTVSDPSGQAQINKNGQSEVREFTYLHTCPPVDEVTAAVRNTQADFSWTPSPYHTHFRVEMLQEGGSSDVSDCYDSKFRLYDFPQGTTWRVRVRGECKGDLEADWSPWTDFSIDPPGTPPTNDECPDCGCDDGPAKREIENYELKELQPGDTIVNRTGRTRFIVLSANATGDGSYSGQFYLWLELWKTKVRCDYTDLKVNTDGVILDGSWRSVHNDGLMVNPATVAENIQNIRNGIANATFDNSISDTIKLGYAIQTIYKDENGRYIAILEDGSEHDLTQDLSTANKTMVEDSKGNKMVVTSDQQVMSAEQYHNTGKNNTLIKNDNERKDKQIAASGDVVFMPSDAQTYGFDAYDASTNNHPEIYPPLEGGSYRPAYKSVAQWQQDKVASDPMQGVTFRNQMGAPYATTSDDIILRGEPQPGETPVYAHVAETDSTTKVVGKLNLLTFEPREISVCLVPVNGATPPNAQTLEKELNKIFKPAVASVKVSTHSGITIEYANGSDFVHGGSGPLTVYSDDEKAAIDALTDADDDTYYLFLVKNVTKLDADGNRTIVSGYMPVGYQHGFIFEQFDVARTIAHELSHGAFALHHTFSANTESFRATEGTTNNLMDYTEHGTTLNHKQWRWMHESHGKGLFGFLADEDEGEIVINETSNDGLVRAFREINCAYHNGQSSVKLYFPTAYGASVKLKDLAPKIGSNRYESDENFVILNLPEGMPVFTNDYVQDEYSLTNIEIGQQQIGLIGEKYGKLTIRCATSNAVKTLLLDNVISKTEITDLNSLQTASSCDISNLSFDKRKDFLKQIGNSTNIYNNSIPDRYQKIANNIISTTNTTNKKELLVFLYDNPDLLKKLYLGIDDYRNEFAELLFELYSNGRDAVGSNVIAYGLKPTLEIAPANMWIDRLLGLNPKTENLFNVEDDGKVHIIIDKYTGWHGVTDYLKNIIKDNREKFEGDYFDVIRYKINDKEYIDIPLFYLAYKSQIEQKETSTDNVLTMLKVPIDMVLFASGIKEIQSASSIVKSEKTLETIARLLLASADFATLGLDELCDGDDSEFCTAYKKYELYVNLGLLSANVLNEFPEIINGLLKGLDNPKLSPKQKDELKAILGETSTKTAKYADNLTGELKKTYEELKTVFAPEKTSLVECIDDGKSIVFNLVGDPDIPLLEIANGKFMVKGWGAHYKGDVVKKLDNGYWVVKNGDSYSIDLGFKEGRKLTGKEVNEYYMGIGKLPPYTDDCIVTEEVLKPGKEFYMVIDGIVEEGGTNVVNHNPGGWATNDAITTIKELRDDMAVRESWKNLEFEPTRVKYRVTKDLPVRNGVVGPQFDFPSAENGQGIIYFGGSQQYEIVLPKEANWWDNGWDDYLIELERLELK